MEYYMNLHDAPFNKIKDKVKNCSITTDIIVGFPGESDEDFLCTYEYLKKQRFLHLHLFPYSKREGTVAAKMSNQVSEETKKARLHKLEEMQKEIKK